MNPKIKSVNTREAPEAIGPYSQAIITDQFVFVSGQIPIDPRIGKIVEHTIRGQTLQVLNNIEAILKAADLDLEDVVKTEIYLKDMNDFSEMNSVYAEKFCHSMKPARQTLQVARLPQDALIEISCIALKNKHTTKDSTALK